MILVYYEELASDEVSGSHRDVNEELGEDVI